MRRVNLLHVIAGLEAGGAEKSLLLLLKNINREKFNPVVVTMFSDRPQNFFTADFQDLKVPLYRLQLKSWRDWQTFRRFRQIIRFHQIDIVHSHTGLLEWYGTFFGCLSGVQICLYTRHNVREKSGLIYRLQRFVLNRLLARKILSISQFVTTHLVSKEYAPLKRIELVYNPVEIPAVYDMDQRLKFKKELNLPIDKFILTNTSRYAEMKGYDIFYQTGARLLERGYPVHLLVTEAGNSRSTHQVLQKHFNVASSTTIALVQKDLSRLYACTDFFLFTSTFQEGFGMVVAEALAAGIPVISLNIGVTSEIVRDKETGLLPYPEKWQVRYDGDNQEVADALADAVISLISNPAERSRLSAKARLYAKQFDAKIFTRRIESIYMNLYNLRH